MLAVLRQVILFIIERFLSSEVINVLAVLRQVILFIIERFLYSEFLLTEVPLYLVTNGIAVL